MGNGGLLGFTPDEWTAIGTVAIAVLTAVLAAATAVYAHLTWRLVKLSTKAVGAAERSAAAATEAAEAAARGAIAAEAGLKVSFDVSHRRFNEVALANRGARVYVTRAQAICDAGQARTRWKDLIPSSGELPQAIHLDERIELKPPKGWYFKDGYGEEMFLVVDFSLTPGGENRRVRLPMPARR